MLMVAFGLVGLGLFGPFGLLVGVIAGGFLSMRTRRVHRPVTGHHELCGCGECWPRR